MKDSGGTGRPARRRGGYTLTELMLALSIFGVASAAVSSLMFASYNMQRQVQGMTDASSAAEITMRRILEVTRSATDLQYTDSTTGLYVETPPDSSNIPYIYIYYISSGNLRERIERADTMAVLQDAVLVNNVSSFSVTLLNAGVFPRSYEVDLVLNAPVPVTRSLVVTGRNLTS